jgi:hypothetical protein
LPVVWATALPCSTFSPLVGVRLRGSFASTLAVDVSFFGAVLVGSTISGALAAGARTGSIAFLVSATS